MSNIEKDKKEAAKKLRKLAYSYFDVNDMVFGFSNYGPKLIKVPEHNGYKESNILISGQLYQLYEQFFKFLENEEKLKYMVSDSKNRKFVEGEIHKFIYDILYDKKYRDNQELDKRINETLDCIYKPLKKYKVVIPIKYFDTEKTHVFEIEDSVISKLDLDKLKKDAIASNPDNESFFEYWSKFEEHYCITISEEGNKTKLVVDRARKKSYEYLNSLRLYFYQVPYKTFAARYFTISNVSFVYDSNDKFIGYFPNNENEPRMQKLNKECVNKIHDSINELKKINQIVNSKTKESIKRCIHWLGKAISEFDLDISLILYCTALESLLIPEVEGKKGEALALRVALIEKKNDNGILNPSLMYNIYEIRSKVVHGSKHEISRKEFITDLEMFVSRILYPFIDFACNNPCMNPFQLMKKLENFEDILEVFLLIDSHSDKFGNSIKLQNYIMNSKLLDGEYLKFTNKGVEKCKEIPCNILDKFFQAAKSSNINVRISAVFSLGFLKECCVIDLLNDILLHDSDIEVKKYAALSLGRLKNQEYTSSEILIRESISKELLIKFLFHEDKGLREKAADALGCFEGPEVTEALIESLKDKKAEVRAISARSLGFIGDKKAFIPLMEALEDDNYRVIVSVSIALGKFKDHNAIEKLKIVRSKKIFRTQEAIDWALSEINK